LNKAADFRASGGIYEDLFVQSRARQTIPTVDDDSRGEDLARPVQVQWYFPHMALCVALEFWTGLLPSILPSFSPELYFFCGISKHQMLRWIEEGWSCRVASGLIVRTRTRLDSRISPSRWLLLGNIGWHIGAENVFVHFGVFYLVFLSEGAHRGTLACWIISWLTC